MLHTCVYLDFFEDVIKPDKSRQTSARQSVYKLKGARTQGHSGYISKELNELISLHNETKGQ